MIPATPPMPPCGTSLKTIVVVPVYNESRTVVSVLERLHSLGEIIHEIVVVEDGSSDDSRDIITEWSRGKEGVTLLCHPTNRGYSEALLTGFRYAIEKMHSDQLSPNDAVATIDADGQHDPPELPGFLRILEDQKLDVVWAQRDFSLYPWMKRLGNRLMSMMGSCFAGTSFKDVESGYCVFRLGPLEDALRFQRRDSRYSLSLTLAVALGRLGYKISNDPMASIKVFRSRTRTIDGLWDTLAAANTWAKVTTSRMKSERDFAVRTVLSTAVFAILAAIMVLIALHSIFLGNDSINNYSHVWYISRHLYDGSLPLHFHNLENGNALTFPYGFFSWMLAALFYPIFGDYAVTWTMLLGMVLILLVIYRTRLKSSPWLLTIFVLVPFFLESLLNCQMSFIWGMLFGYLYIWSLEKRSFKWAFLWLILAAGNHLIIMSPILAGYTAYVYWNVPDLRRNLSWMWALAGIPLVPLAWYTLNTPAVEENNNGFILYIFLITLLPRAILFFSPFIIAKLSAIRISWTRQRHAMWTAGILCLLVASVWHAGVVSGYSNLVTTAHNDYRAYTESAAFVPGAIYRMPEGPRHEQGQYYLIQAGAVLSNEFFNESKFRRNWTEESYRCFLSTKEIDYVVLCENYVRTYHKNEGQILKNLQSEGLASVVYRDPEGLFTVYEVRGARTTSEKHSVKECIKLEKHSGQ
jgi:glycosyltransferase involved in cell wall biosynthesis